MEINKKTELVTLTKCGTLPEADVIVAHLDAGGIKANLPDEFLMQTVAWDASTYGFIRVQVSAKDLQAAKDLLASIAQPSDLTSADERERARQIAQDRLSWPVRCVALLLPAWLLFGLAIFIILKSSYQRRGYQRKVNELWYWSIIGAVLWFIAFCILIAYAEGKH